MSVSVMMPVLNVVLIELGSLFLILLNYLLDRLMILLLFLHSRSGKYLEEIK